MQHGGRRLRRAPGPDGGGDPRPGIGGEPAAAVGVEPVDRRDQAERARLHRLVEGVAAQPEVVRSQRHEPQALADEGVARLAIARARGPRERAFAIRVEGWLGQQVTREGIHVTSVDAAPIAAPERRGRLWTDSGWGRSGADGAAAHRAVLLLQGDELAEHPVVALGLLDRVGALELRLQLGDAAGQREAPGAARWWPRRPPASTTRGRAAAPPRRRTARAAGRRTARRRRCAGPTTSRGPWATPAR